MRIGIAVAAWIVALAVAPGAARATEVAQVPPPAAAPAASGTIAGIASDAGGAPLAGVRVTAVGPTTATATSDANGAYAFTGLPPGLYTVSAAKTGYNGTTQPDVAVVAGAPQTLNVTLAQATLSSLREIGRVTVNTGRSGFNASPAAVNIISSQAFLEQSQPQVARILNQTPGIVSSLPGGVNNASPGAITFPNIRGALSFETAALVDGHPLSVGQYGDYVTTFLNSFVLQDVELIKGPGAASPTISRAVGGTVNFRTLDPSTRPRGTFTLGADSFGGVFSNFGYSNTVGRLGFLFDYAVNGTPGPVKNQQYQMALDSTAYLVSDSHGNPIALPNPSVSSTFPDPHGQYNFRGEAATTLLFCCTAPTTTFTNKNELVKLRYKLSDATSLTAGFLGSQTFSDQNGNNGNFTTTQFTPGPGYAGGVNAGTQPIIDPDNFGQPAHEINNEPIFQAELRSSFHADTVLARYYAASISRLQYGTNPDPNADSSFRARIYGGGDGAGTPAFNGLDQYGQPYTITIPGLANQDPNVANGNVSTGNAYYDSAEEDRIAGASFEYDHFLGTSSGNVVSFSYDQNHARTHSYSAAYNTDSVPAGSTQDTKTLLLRGIFNLGKLNLTASNYLTNFKSHYGVYDTTDFSAPPVLSFQDQSLWHYDGRLGLVLRPNVDTSLRFSLGSAVAPPYLGALVANTFAPQACRGQTGRQPCLPGGGLIAYSQSANPGLAAETTFGYDLGGDHRFRDGTVISGDFYLTNLRNQLVRSTFLNGTAAITQKGVTSTVPLYTTAYTNVSNARYEGLELGIRRDPPLGLGYLAQGALLRAFPYNLASSFYASGANPFANNLGVVPNLNFGAHQTVSNQAIPYAQAYGELRYRFANAALATFGETYYGPNNSLNVPAFFVANATARVPAGQHGYVQLSIDNLFAAYSDSFTNEYVGNRQPFINGQYYASNANVIGPRVVRLSFTHSFGSR